LEFLYPEGEYPDTEILIYDVGNYWWNYYYYWSYYWDYDTKGVWV